MPKVCIIIVNWNGKDIVIKTLESVMQLTYKDFDVVVVDNASSDGSVEFIKNRFSEVKVIMNKKNLGGTGGFNTGIRHALKKKYPYIWLLDNDVIVDRDSLLSLVEVMEKDSGIGIAGSKILQMENPDIIWEVGVKMDWNKVGRVLINHNMKDTTDDHRVYEVDHVAACSLLVRTSSINKVGLMDENYFWCFDDVDWCLSFKKGGFKVVAVSDSKIWHPNFEEKSKGKISKRNYFSTRNWLYLIQKHTNGFQKMRCIRKTLAREFSAMFIYKLNDNEYAYRIFSMAVKDFFFAKLGGVTGDFDKAAPELKSELKSMGKIIDIKKLNPRKILIYPSTSISDARKVVNAIRNILPDAEIHFLIEENRKFGLTDLGINTFIPYKGPTRLYFLELLKLRRNSYDLGIMPYKTFSDIDIMKRILRYEDDQFYEIERNNMVLQITKMLLSTVVGELLGTILLPFWWTRKFAHSEYLVK